MNALLWFGTLIAAKGDFNENSVTPTWVGFAATFGVGALTVLIIIDMTRRIRRVRYRGEIREKLENERDSLEKERDSEE